MELEKQNFRRRENPVTSKKYLLDYCSARVSDDKNSRDWLIMKNILLSGKVMSGILNNNMKVVIKVGSENSRIAHEYNINKVLQKYKGFVRYICKFSCRDNLKKYLPRDDNGIWLKDEGFCEVDGPNRTHPIIMPYYPIGSILHYKWEQKNIEVLKMLLNNVIATLIKTNAEVGFVHGDFHLDNLMLQESKSGELGVDIIDFEMSEINDLNKGDGRKVAKDLKKLFVDILRLDVFTGQSVSHCITLTEKLRDPFESVNVNDVFRLVSELKTLKMQINGG